ncbi:MAG TPA: SurA N-terminal domain-containing protein [Pyrinomonadaceae bacterium]|jgi:peptidyl-prolyl cis-trans isomerase D
MLKQLSRLERTRSLVIIAFAVMMAVSLIIFYAPGRNSAAVPPSKNTDVLAKVGRDEITVADLSRYKENLQKRLGGQFNLAQMGSDRRFLDGLIQGRVVAQEAERLGLGASDQEVADMIRKQFVDPGGQFVGYDRYKEIVAANYGGTVEAFERELRDTITEKKLRAFVTAGVSVSPEEVQDDYKRKNTTFNLVYVPVSADKLAAKIQPTDQELHAYFDQHKAEYHINAPQKKIRYIYIDQAKAGAKLNVSDEDLHKRYDALTPENKQAGVKVQQIVLKVARADLDASVKEKADKLVAQARGDSGNVTEEKFAELARGNSEDTATAKNGGAIPFVVKKNPNKPDDPLQKTLDLQPGAVTEPIKYGNAYFIFRRGDAVAKTFDEAKQELLVSARNSQAYGAAAALAKRVAESLKQNHDVQKTAQQFAAEANMTPAEMVKETGYIKPGDDVKDIGASQDFERAIDRLNAPNDVGDQTPVKGGFAIPMLVDKKDPRDPDFEEVKEQVAAALKAEKARAQIEQAARDIANSASSANDLKAAAEKLGLEAKTSDNYKLGSPLSTEGTNPISSSAPTDEAIYAMKEGEVTRTPLKVGDTWMVIGITKRTDPDLAEFSRQRDTLTDSMLQDRRSQVFEDYLSNLQARMLREGRIKVYTDVLARMAEEEPPAAAPQQPRLPPGFPQQSK